MSYVKLLSPERKEFVYKINNEMYNNATANSDKKDRKDYFFSLIEKNKELFENEKEFCKERFTHEVELRNARYKEGKQKECNKCKLIRYSDRFCEGCISLQLQSLFTTWTSGNSIIDDFIQQCQTKSSLPGYILEWIPFEQFKNVTKLTEGEFSSVYTAEWERGRIIDYDENKKEFGYFGAQFVVLKSLNDSSNLGKGFFDEAMNYCKIKPGMVLQCYGITKFPDNGNYAMISSYYPDRSLRSYLQKNHLNLTLKDRILVFRYLCNALYNIHMKDLIHCDLRSGNILVAGGNCYIIDLGLCGPVDNEKSSDKVYEIVSYVAPELLRGEKNTKESDIYSAGMLMWEIFAGHPPFDDRAHDHHLISDICEEGLRPPILRGMPHDYVQMMQKCWDVDPSKRPTILELFIFAESKLKEICDNIDGNNSSNNTTGGSSNLQQVHKPHPGAYHKSRILDEEIAKSRSFKSYTNSDNS